MERIYLLIRGDQNSSLNRFRREMLDSPALAPLREQLGARFDHYIEEKVVIIPGDITEPGSRQRRRRSARRGTLDAVVHCAGLVNFEASLEKAISINTIGVANVIEFCRKHDAAMMHVSTCYAAGVADGHRYEDDIADDWCPDRQAQLQPAARDSRGAGHRRARRGRIARSGSPGGTVRATMMIEPVTDDDDVQPVADGRGASTGSKSGLRKSA